MTKGIHQQPMKEGSEEGTGLSVEESVQIYGQEYMWHYGNYRPRMKFGAR